MKNFTNLLIFLGIISFVFLGCAKSDDSSSSSSDTDVTAVSGSGSITLSAKVSVVEPKTTDSTARTAYAIDTTGFASTADYNVDETQTFVFEESADVLDTVNSILCEIGQTRPGLMLNEGNYKAQVDSKKCGSGDGDSKSNAPSYDMWTVNSSRSEGEPMIITAWPPMDPPVRAKMKVYRKPSTDYPVGFFKMSFKSVASDGTEAMKGYMKTSKSGTTNSIKFYMPMTMGSTTYDYSVKVNFNSDGSGSGATSMPNWTGQDQATGDKSFQVAYNTNYFYKQKTLNGVEQDAVCLDRNKYFTSVWRYGMYDSNGARVAVNSGFPITATASGTTYNGYIGYYGLWMPSEAGVADNSTVTKMDYSNPDAAGTDYTLRSWGGKLIKYTKNTITLGSIKNIPLNWWDNSAGYEKRVFWNGTNFTADAYRNDSTSWQWADMTEATLTLSASNAEHGFHFYAQALGGDGQIVLAYPSGRGTAPTAPTDDSSVIFNTQEPVFPGDTVPTALACYDRCLNPSTIATGSDSYGSSSSIFHGKKWLGWGGSSWVKGSGEMDNASAPDPYIYTFDNTTSGMVLQYDNGTKTDVLLPTANSNLSWGARSGIMFDNSTFDNDTSARQADFAALLCSWDTTKICPWQARGALSTFYVWETGPQSWNKLEVLVASDNSSVKFDPPMMVKYTHSGTTSNSGKNYDNASFYLEYGGLGDLHGIPSFCVNRITGIKGACDENSRWVNEVVIPAASLATQVKDGTTEYVIKPLEMEQTMQSASSTSVCTDAGLSLGGVTLPDSSGWNDPEIGAEPTVTGPPAVVDGDKTGS
ncbi:MAG TPA: hypothetical protein EYO28_05245 [Candidatus Lambdaproteobacteria bacterium]|nr:hypothetical protein [Candidatus Lambdaproteobacteria bacterium]